MASLAKYLIKKAASAVSEALKRGGTGGVSKEGAKEIAKTAIGQDVPNDSWGPILFLARAKRIDNRYFPVGYYPKSVHDERARKAEQNPSPPEPIEQVELAGDLDVTVKGPGGLHLRSKAKKIIIFFVGCFLLVLLFKWGVI